MTKTLAPTLALAAALSLAACAKHDGNTTDAGASINDTSLNDTLPVDETGLSGNGDTLNADLPADGNGTDLNSAAPLGNAQ